MINFRFCRKLISMSSAGIVFVTGFSYAKADMHAEGDTVTTKANLNVRTDNDLNGEIISHIPNGYSVQRILSCDNGWSLIRYNNRIGFVNNDYIIDSSDENIYGDLKFVEMRKLLETTDNVNIRLDPFIKDNVIGRILKGEKVNILAYVSNNWYLVNYDGKLGFVSGDYLKEVEVKTISVVRAHHQVNIRSRASKDSDRLDIMYPGDELPFLEDYNSDWYKIDYFGVEAYVMKQFVDFVSYTPIDIMRVVYVENDSPLLSEANGEAAPVDYLEKGQTGEVLSEEGDYYFIRTFEHEGYIRKSNTSNLKGLVIVIDLSTQKLVLYEDGNILIKTNVTTGKSSTPTIPGTYKIQAKNTDYYMSNPNITVAIAMQFDGNYLIHTYPMNGFGMGVADSNRSHGCCRGPEPALRLVYQRVKVGTPVIIHN